MDPIIKVKNVTKQYRARTAIKDLSFELYPGQILGLLGPNGAGKTTTMRMLMGLSRPTSGTITILGYDSIKGRKAIHSQIGVVFEKPNLFENLSAYHNLAIYCKLYNKPLTRIQPLLERMDLWERAQEPVKTFSKGMRQRISLLRALVHQPRLLVLDEPASGLDPISSKIIRDYLQEEKKRGITVVLTSHDMEEVDQLCDQIGFINHGRLIALGRTDELKRKYGQQKLKVTFCQHREIHEEILEPTAESFNYIRQLYGNNQIVSVHSMEASLSEIFHKLSEAGFEPSSSQK